MDDKLSKYNFEVEYDNGKSNRQAAKQEGISEGTIRHVS